MTNRSEESRIDDGQQSNRAENMKWARVSVTTSPEATDAVTNHLFEQDAVGVELKDGSASVVELISYFPMDDLVGERVEGIRKFLNQLPEWGLPAQSTEVLIESIVQKDWATHWRSAFPPLKIGKRLIVAPTWHHLKPKASEVLIRLDPGMAFGTGQHPTTHLSLELLEECINGGEVVADLGTGSGILSIAAAKLGAKRIDAVDLDATTIPIARENFQHNGVASIISLTQGDGVKVLNAKYHLIVANILTKVIIPMIPKLPQFLRTDGRVILSGVMAQEAKQVESVLQAHGFHNIRTRTEADWVGIQAKWGSEELNAEGQRRRGSEEL